MKRTERQLGGVKMVPASVGYGDIGRALVVDKSYWVPGGVFVRAEGSQSDGHGLHLTNEEAMEFAVSILRVAGGGTP